MNMVTRIFRGDSYVALSFLKNDKYIAPLAGSGQAFRKRLNYMLLLLSAVETYYQQVWNTLQQSP